jgi:hypothetical protein
VLLKNVLSFDVKVLNDDVLEGENGLVFPSDQTSNDLTVAGTGSPLAPNESLDWPACRTTSLALLSPADSALKLNLLGANLARPGSWGVNASVPTDVVTFAGIPSPAAMTQPDFIDLGQTLNEERPASFAAAGARCMIDKSLLPSGWTTLPPGFTASGIPWGSQTPARWASTGRIEAGAAAYNTVAGTSYQPMRSTYDTWASEYRPELFARRFDTNPAPTTNLGNYLPPYDRPLRGIQITIRVLEPRSGLVREFQVVHRFR